MKRLTAATITTLFLATSLQAFPGLFSKARMKSVTTEYKTSVAALYKYRERMKQYCAREEYADAEQTLLNPTRFNEYYSTVTMSHPPTRYWPATEVERLFDCVDYNYYREGKEDLYNDFLKDVFRTHMAEPTYDPYTPAPRIASTALSKIEADDEYFKRAILNHRDHYQRTINTLEALVSPGDPRTLIDAVSENPPETIHVYLAALNKIEDTTWIRDYLLTVRSTLDEVTVTFHDHDYQLPDPELIAATAYVMQDLHEHFTEAEAAELETLFDPLWTNELQELFEEDSHSHDFNMGEDNNNFLNPLTCPFSND